MNIIMPYTYGFIRPDDGTPDIFFHQVGVVNPLNFDDLREGYRVTYLQTEDKKGRARAIGIVVD